MPRPHRDLTGRTFTRLTALSPILGGQTKWRCECSCGSSVTVRAAHLLSGAVKSCGCLRSEKSGRQASTLNVIHGMTSGGVPPEYACWSAMKSRCLNPSNKSYPHYGGRGIDVDPRWVESFPAFIADVGPRPSAAHSLDRIDNGRGYWPDNVRWTTADVQAQNRRRLRGKAYKLTAEDVAEIRRLHAAGERQTAIAKRFGVSQSQVSLIVLRKRWEAA